MGIGRPTFQLIPERLQNLRKEAGLTQSEVASAAHRLLEKPEFQAQVAVKHYQRIEHTGKTSAKMAGALAQVLGTTVAVLRGEAPEPVPDLIAALELQLQTKLSNGANPSLQALMDQHEECDEPVRSVATYLAAQIESAQIEQHSGLIDRLATITGWTQEKLTQPTSFLGHWLVTSTTRAERTADIVTGCLAVVRLIETAFSELLVEGTSDRYCQISEHSPWIRVEVLPARTAELPLAVSFVRCQAGPSGLSWVKPTWRDQILLDEYLRDFAYRTFNFVTDRGGQRRPNDLRKLRLLIEANDGVDFTTIRKIEGSVPDLPEEILQQFREIGQGHRLIMNWLCIDLLTEVSSLMASHSDEDWDFIAGDRQIAIQLRAPNYREHEQYLLWAKCMGQPYRIRLVEETDEGLLPIPWRAECITELVAEIKSKRADTAVRGVA